MDRLVFAGKAFCVVEDLRQFAEKYKGKTVQQALREIRQKKLEETVKKQLEEMGVIYETRNYY